MFTVFLTVQRIYYPGFTIAGLAEGCSLIAARILLLALLGCALATS